MGKTTVGLSAAIAAAKSGKGVGFISLEMDADKLGARAASDMAYDWAVKVPYADIIRGHVEAGEIDAVQSALRDIERLPLWIEDQSALSMTDIRIKAEAMMSASSKHGTPLEALFVDHLGLIRPSSRYQGNRTNEVAEMSAGLKSLAREYGIAVIALSQLNRALESRDSKKPQLSDLRDSGAIEQDADTIIFLYREAYYLEREQGKSEEAETARLNRLIEVQNKLEFHIAKQRNGPVTSIDLFVDMACSVVRNGVRR
jgi:replicative DNA helicase